MNPKPPAPLPAKVERSPHEVSGDEAKPVETRRQQAGGGGHRSGSRGAGTFENSDGKPEPGQGPKGDGLERSRDAQATGERALA